MDKDKFAQLWDEIEKDVCIKPDIKEYFGLPNSFDKIGEYYSAANYHNYNDQLRTLLREFISFIRISEDGVADKKTKIILIVGQSGIGKTTFVNHFNEQVTEIINKKRFIDNVKYENPVSGIGFSAKLLTLNDFLHKLDKDEKRFGLLDEKQKQIIVFEDLQELFLEINPKHDYRKEFFERINRYNNCFIILTTTVTNWYNLLTASPDIKYNFDAIINLDGLNEEYLYDIYEERIKPSKFEIPGDKLHLIIKLANKNPRLLFLFFSNLYESMYKDETLEITDTHINFVKSKMGFDISNNLNDTQSFLLNELTAMDDMYPTLIANKTALSRTAVTQNLNVLEKLGYVVKNKEGKNSYYHLKLAIRNELEQKVLSKINEVKLKLEKNKDA